jgi:hypothetical protein
MVLYNVKQNEKIRLEDFIATGYNEYLSWYDVNFQYLYHLHMRTDVTGDVIVIWSLSSQKG